MSKKHFQALAIAIGGIADNAERKRMARLIGAVCADCNRSFDWGRWLSACNVRQEG